MSSDQAQLLAVFAGLFGFATAIFWMVIGYYAMMAHIRLAKATEEIARRMGDGR
ncbi:MAG TPA: hypothetical protein VFC07_01180 [Verrucomicrobiae bacterium]|nr:hypothetical protein [Verrucomicrobiae bacterium]